MSTTLHTLEPDEIRSLQRGELVELDGKISVFLGKGDPDGRIASYSFLLPDGKVKSYKGTLGLMHRGLKRVEG